VLWAIATLALAVVVLPWPGALDRFGSAHVLFLALMALSAAGAAAFSARVR
jgi:hypothetical protein